MAVGSRDKDPDAKRRYTINWAPWLRSQADVPETIEASEWLVPTGLTKLDDSFDTTKTVVWLSGGTLGARYDVVNRITTNSGQIQDSTIELLIVQK